jgi:putative peptidoglycan lipid II flippase
VEATETKRSTFRAAGVVGSFTLLSRVFGFVRDMVIANYFGAAAVADAFFIAFRIPNLLRRLTAEGALSAAFIPLFAKTLKTDREEAFRLANNLLCTLTFFLVLVVTAGIIFSPALLSVIAVGFTDEPEKFELTVYLTRLLFPYLIFISLAALVMGILNTLNHFAAPAASPVLLNISIIVSVMLLRDLFSLPVYSLVAGVLAGGILQLGMQIPFAIRQGFKFFYLVDLKSKLLRKVLLLTAPAVLGFAVAEINMFVDTILASLLKEGYLYYGNRLVQFPLGVFGIAMSTALLPTLSFQAGDNDLGKMAETISKSFRMVMLLIIPSTVGLIVMREPIINILFERGEFDSVSTANTGIALAYYSIGLLAFVGVKIFVSGFYALGDTKTPVKVATYAMIINIALNIILMGPLEHGGLALATSLSSFFNLAFLIIIIRKPLGKLDGKGILKSFTLLLAASAVMAGFLLAGWGWFFPDGYTVTGLIVSIVPAAMIYFAVVWILRMEELHSIAGAVKRRFGKNNNA